MNKPTRTYEISYFLDVIEINIKHFTPLSGQEFLDELDALRERIVDELKSPDSNFVAYNRHGDTRLGEPV